MVFDSVLSKQLFLTQLFKSTTNLLGPGGPPYNINGLYGEALPKRGTFFELQGYERVGMSPVEASERVCWEICHCGLQKDLKGLTDAFYSFMAAKKTRELSGLVVYSYLKEDTFTAAKKMQCSK